MNANYQLEQGLLTAIKKTGLTAPDTVVADGKVHRFRSEVGSKNQNGWYILHLNPKPCGIFGCWKNMSEKQFWFPDVPSGQPNSEQFIKYNAEIKLLQEQWDAERVVAQELSSKRAEVEWADAEEPKNHPYLDKKGVGNYGLKLQGDRLLVPLRDQSGNLYSLQRITSKGDKKFLTGGKIDGCFHLFGK